MGIKIMGPRIERSTDRQSIGVGRLTRSQFQLGSLQKLKNIYKSLQGNKTREIVLYQDWDFVIWRENKEKKIVAINWTDWNWAACKI